MNELYEKYSKNVLTYLKMTVGTGNRNGGVVANHLGADHCHGFTLCGIDLKTQNMKHNDGLITRQTIIKNN